MPPNKLFRMIAACGMATIILLLIGLGYAGLYAAREQQNNLFWVEHTYDVKSAIDDLVGASRNIAISQRSYVLNGSDSALASFEAAANEVPTFLANLRFLLRDNPEQIRRADELTATFNERLDESIFNVQQRRSGEYEEAAARYLRGRSNVLSDLGSQQMKVMADEEDRLLTERLKITSDNAQKTKYLIVGGAGFTIFAIFLATFIVFRDLWHRLETERALRDSSAALEKTLGMQRTLVNSANYAIIATDMDGLITEFNAGAERMLGYKAHEMIGKANPGIFHVPGEVVAQAEKLSQELGIEIRPGFAVFTTKALRGQPQTAEWTFVRKDRTTFPAELSVSLVRDGEGVALGFLGIASDITERKKIERLKNEFISTVSHELRTPLTSIRGSLGLVLGGIAGEIPPQGKSLIDIAHKNAERLGRLINDILDIEKIESGKMEFQIKRQPLAPLLKQSIDSTSDYGVQYGVTFNLADEAPGVDVDVDGDRFMQVMANLLSNAAKFSPQGGTVDVSAVLLDKMLRITVADKGKGIPPEFHGRIFEKFAQADSSDTRQKGGTGLGLSITKAMIEHMGGRIGFASVIDQGTEFFIDLPAMNAAALISPARSGDVPVRPCVLICEDDADIALLLRMMLDQGGFDSDIVTTATAAQERLAMPGRYVALTLDIALPDKSGLDLFRDLRALPQTKYLPIIFVSAEADKGRKELNGAAVGVIDWLQKPIDPQRLLHAIRLAANRSQEATAIVLHVEDDPDLIHVVTGIIQPVARIDGAQTLTEAREKLASGQHYDLVLLDLTLPDGDGAELLPLIPPDMPVVIFSARDVPEGLARRVSSALTKSRTSNEALFKSITAIIDKMAASRLS